MIDVEVENRSGREVDANAAIALARRALAAEGVEEGELGLQFVGAGEMRDLKREHLGIDEPTDVLSFPIDGTDPLPDGIPRQLGDVVLCPEVVGEEWRWPLVHGLLHLLGYDHGAEMEAREQGLLSGVGSTEPPKSGGAGLAGAGAGSGGVGSTEPLESGGGGLAGAGAGSGGVGSTEPPGSGGGGFAGAGAGSGGVGSTEPPGSGGGGLAGAGAGSGGVGSTEPPESGGGGFAGAGAGT